MMQRAAAHGLGADDVLVSLERFHDEPLPAEVVQLVRRWAKHWGRGVLSALTLLQVESAEVLADLLADPEVAPHVRRLEGAATVAGAWDGTRRPPALRPAAPPESPSRWIVFILILSASMDADPLERVNGL